MGKPKILLVEDEVDLAEPVQQGLTEAGYDVQLATTAVAARRQFESEWDLVILDLNLPDMPGERLLNYLKQSPSYPPVIVVTARAGVEDKLTLFRLGCDDYVTKPFIFAELLVRVEALLRRGRRILREQCTYEDIELDPAAHRLKAGEKSVVLTPKESAICRILLSEPGRIITRKDILQNVWGQSEEGVTNLIGVHVFNLRKKFAQLGREDWFVTVRNAGFTVANPETVDHGS